MSEDTPPSTLHKIIKGNSADISGVPDETVDLVVTSPPYPMIEMWDDIFSSQDRRVKPALDNGDGERAFSVMHEVLARTWKEVRRVLKDGGHACINIGDATRTIDGQFRIYNSHARILQEFSELGFTPLPSIVWRKQTNAPNKFMGSGMLPPGAYVTLEHEHILVLRKGDRKETASSKDMKRRRESAYFWEERNLWFSDVWTDIKGTPQGLRLENSRDRSGAFPLELAYRLVNMFSVKGDVVLDPFAGTGTTNIAALSSERNSFGVEVDPHFTPIIRKRIMGSKAEVNDHISKRLSRHLSFVKSGYKKPFKYRNPHHDFPVVTRQETEAVIRYVSSIVEEDPGVSFEVFYVDSQSKEFRLPSSNLDSF